LRVCRTREGVKALFFVKWEKERWSLSEIDKGSVLGSLEISVDRD
jgi:hypothetical protein